MRTSVYLQFPVAIALLLAAQATHAGKNLYVTWTGIGPDKWASAWLIERHLDAGAEIRFMESGSEPDSGIAFDIPGIPPYLRDSERTTYESLLEGHDAADPVLERIGGIIRDIEVNYWGAPQSPAAPLVEHAFRGLQFKYGRENVPRACYFELFDSLYRHFDMAGGNAADTALEQALAQDGRCGSVNRAAARDDGKYVAEWRPEEILAFIDAGDRVVFVDTRETGEFEEGHIPGAINLKLRDIGARLPPELANADVVVPYCVKDFRGFEVAKRLKRLGVRTVGLMNPYGIAGWKASGLPVAGTRGLREQEGAEQLRFCADQPAACMADG